MNDRGGGLWQRSGVSVTWDADALATAAEGGVTVSLRQALAWAEAMPDEPPGGVRTVVVTGLQTAFDVLGTEGRVLLRDELRGLMARKRDTWPEAGLVFAVQVGDRLDVDVASERLLMTLPDGSTEEIGTLLWGGAAREATPITALRADGKGPARERTIGYWLRRSS